MNEGQIDYVISCIKSFSEVILDYELLSKIKLLTYG